MDRAMKRIIPTVVVLSLLLLLLASCEKEPMAGRRGGAPAIKLTVGGVYDTKAQVITDKSTHSTYSSAIYDFIETNGFNISAYVTGKWSRDSIGQGPQVYEPGIYIDPGDYEGPYDESTYPSSANKLEDVLVTFDDSRDNEKWRISGNDGANYAGHKFSWISGVATNFFAYAPVAVNGTRNITKAETGTTSIDANYPFTYDATSAATGGVVTADKCDDLIFAFTQHVATFGTDPSDAVHYGELVSGSTDKFNLTFYHALAQIRFCVSTNDGTFDPSIKLKSITLKGVSNAGMVANGSCVFNGSASTFGWTLGTKKVNYTQTFGGTDGVTFGATAPTGWTLGSYTDSASNTFNLYTCAGDVLFLIPQNPKDCVVDITLSVGGTDTTITGKLQAVSSSDSSKIWEAGKVYTYKVKAGKNGGLDLLPDGWANGGGNINI